MTIPDISNPYERNGPDLLSPSRLAPADPAGFREARLDGPDAESFAYRCLPLNIANAHGWELLNPCAFDACWNGQTDTSAVTIRPQGKAPAECIATSLFGQGIITFHIPGIFRTPPGWNLWIGGSPNQPKDGIYPLTGVVETDWSPFTFTMNWRFTRPNHWVRFEAGEPICFIFPVQRAVLEDVKPVLAPIDAEPELLERFQAWSSGRDEFVKRVADTPPQAAADKWQKHYYRGIDTSEKEQIDDHRAKLRLKPFDASAMSWPAETPVPGACEAGAPCATEPAATAAVAPAPNRRIRPAPCLTCASANGCCETLEWQRGLSPQNSGYRAAGGSFER